MERREWFRKLLAGVGALVFWRKAKPADVLVEVLRREDHYKRIPGTDSYRHEIYYYDPKTGQRSQPSPPETVMVKFNTRIWRNGA